MYKYVLDFITATKCELDVAKVVDTKWIVEIFRMRTTNIKIWNERYLQVS